MVSAAHSCGFCGRIAAAPAMVGAETAICEDCATEARRDPLPEEGRFLRVAAAVGEVATCSFCAKGADRAKRMVAAGRHRICDECLALVGAVAQQPGDESDEDSMLDLSHLDSEGRVHMVDVGDKPATRRVAVAEALVRMSAPTRHLLFEGGLPKGDALAAARVAGIMAAKRTPELLPLCHPLPLSHVAVELDEVALGVQVVARVETTASTGVEMEAMTAVAVAALTIYDMVKGVERGAEVRAVRLLHKSGGRSGEWNA